METKFDSARREWLADELQNFQEIARYLNPSPGEIPEIPDIDIAGLSMPLRDVIGGDHVIYLDFKRRYDLERRIATAEDQERPEVARRLRGLKNRAGILVADVSGHRMTDALIGAMLHQAFLLGVYYELDISGEVTTRLFEYIHQRFYQTNAINKFFTMIYGEISREGKFRFLSAGHQAPAVFSREYGRFMEVSKDQLVSFQPVGMLPSAAEIDDAPPATGKGYKKPYEINEIKLLAAGDILLLCTDGLIEHAEGQYYPTKAERLLADAGGASAAEICARMRADLLACAAPKDDISVVVIRNAAPPTVSKR